MKYAVVTFSSGREWLPGLTNPVKEAYCLRHGYDFVFKSKPVHPDRPPSWEKLEAVKEVLKKHDVVLWMDDDAVPSNWGVRFETLLPIWCYMGIARDYMYLNAGVFIMRRTAESFQLLDKWQGLYEKYKDSALWEQDALQELYADRPYGIHVLPAARLNSFEGAFRGDADKFKPWQSGDFAYHFSGQSPYTDDKKAFLAEMISEITRSNS